MKRLIFFVLSCILLMPSTAWGEEYTYDSGSFYGWDGDAGMYSCLTIDFQNSTTVYSPAKFSNISKVEIVAGGASQIYSSFAVSVNGSDYQSIVSTTRNGYVVPNNVDYDTYTFIFTPEKEPQYIKISAQYDAMSGTQGWVYIQSVTVYTEEDTEPYGNCDMSEIPTTNAYYAATSFLCERGILDGSKVDGKYSVGKELLRQHLANITFRGLFTLKGREIPSTFVSDQYSAIYEDLKSDALYYRAAKTLLYLDYGDGITPFDRDRDGFFPNGYESRINVLKELMEAFNIKPDTEGTNNPFPNEADIAQLSETSPIRMGYVRQAAKLGIITTENTEFHPFVDCLRGDAFLMLARIIQKIEAGEIADPNPQESDFLDPNSGTGTAEPYAVLSNNNTVLTFYYDGQKVKRNGLDVGPFSGSNYDYPSWFCLKSITSVVFDESFANCTTLTSTAYWFFGLENLSSITGIGNFKTGNVTNMGHMFYRCSGLKELDLSGFNTQNATDMKRMFYCCSGLKELDLSGFKTDNVTNMGYMFYGCSGLKELDLSGFNTQNVTDMECMFYECSGLTSLVVTGFNTQNVTNMGLMFIDCSSLTTIYAGDGWSTAAVTSIGIMFTNCTNLKGGAGTVYDDNHIDYTYARIDGGPDNPGYFTAKAEGSGEQLEGDLNHDGKVDSADIVTLVNMIMSKKKENQQ